VDRSEVARGDNDVRLDGHFREPLRPPEIAMEVAEGEQLHARRS
jgi:hypothetical protein